MAKFGFSKEGNLKEIKRGDSALRTLLLPVTKFGFQDLSLFKKNFRYDVDQRLDFIPNNHKFLVAINSPNVGPKSATIEIRNISDVSPDSIVGTRNLSIEPGDGVLCSPNSDIVTGGSFSLNRILSVTKPQSGLDDIGTILLSSQIRNGEGASDESEFYTDSNKPGGYVGGGLINSFKERRNENEKVAIIKQNSATYNSTSGRFTFGTDIDLTFTEGDLVSKVNVKGQPEFNIAGGSTYFDKRNGDVKYGSSFYPLVVSEYDINELGQTSFILKRPETNSPVLFNKIKVGHENVYGHNLVLGKALLVNELQGGTFSASEENDKEFGTGIYPAISQSSTYPLTTTGSGTGLQISIKTQNKRVIKVTIIDGGSGHILGDEITCPKENILTDSLTTGSGTIDLKFKIGSATTIYNAESPQLMIFNSPNIIQFTRQVPISESDLRGLVPPILRAQGGPKTLIRLGDDQSGGTGSVKNLYRHFEGLGQMYNLQGTTDRFSNTESDWQNVLIEHTFKEVLSEIQGEVDVAEEIGLQKITTNTDNINTSSENLVIGGALQIQDPIGVNDVNDISDETTGNLFNDCPHAPAVYIKEEDLENPGTYAYTRAFSTFDGPWTADSSAGKKHIRTFETVDQSNPSFVTTINIGKLEFEDRIVIEDYASRHIVEPTLAQESTAGTIYAENRINQPAGSFTSSLNSPRSTGFTHKMPIVIKEKDITTGEINDVIYFLLLKGPLT